MEQKLEGLTGKMMTSEGGMRVLSAPFFANAEMASRAIDDAVSNPVYQGYQVSTSSSVTTQDSPKPNNTPTGYIYRQSA